MKMNNFMRSITGMILIWCILGCSFYFSIQYIKHYDKSDLEIGQIWVCKNNENDPFKVISYDTSKIINIKDNYVKYILNNNNYKYSCTKYQFLIVNDYQIK